MFARAKQSAPRTQRKDSALRRDTNHHHHHHNHHHHHLHTDGRPVRATHTHVRANPVSVGRVSIRRGPLPVNFAVGENSFNRDGTERQIVPVTTRDLHTHIDTHKHIRERERARDFRVFHSYTRRGKRRVATQGTQRTTPPPQRFCASGSDYTRNLTASSCQRKKRSREILSNRGNR